MGAVFQVVGLLKDSTPDKRIYDSETIAAVESVTYGSTFGAITGGIEAGEDSVIIKQAINIFGIDHLHHFVSFGTFVCVLIFQGHLFPASRIAILPALWHKRTTIVFCDEASRYWRV